MGSQGLRILMTGGSGLVGSRLAPMLRGRHEVTHLDMVDPGDGLPAIVADLRDPEAVREACVDRDVVIHLAGMHGAAWQAAGDHALMELNLMGTHNVLEGAAAAGVKRVVFTSSIHATGRYPTPVPYLPIDEDLPREPLDIYGLSKQLGEQMCRSAAALHGMSVICLRPGWIAPEDAELNRQFTKVFFGVDVRDGAKAHMLAAEAPAGIPSGPILVTAESPLCSVDPAQYWADPWGTLEGFYPGIRELADAGTLTLHGQQEWHSTELARCLLGYEPQHNFTMPD